MFHPLFDLTGRVALVSGAAQNMGRAAAIALAEIGADLLIADVNEQGLHDTAETIRSLGRRVIPGVYDVWNEEQIRAMYQQVDREFGRIDIAVNIPGGNRLGHPEEIAVEQFVQVIQATLVSKFISCQEAGRRMLAQGKGSIINMSSIGGVRTLGRGNFAYSVGQAGVVQMTRELSTEWADRGCASMPWRQPRSPTLASTSAWTIPRGCANASCAGSPWGDWVYPTTSRGS